MKKYLFLGIILIMSFSFLMGCSKNKYNATLYDDVNEWIDEDFSTTNLTYGAYYDDVLLEDDSYPVARDFILCSQQECEGVIKNLSELNVNFEEEMLILYTFTTVYHRDIKLKNIEVTDDVLKISLQFDKKSGVGDAAMPYQRFLILKLERLEIASVEIELN